MSKKDTKKARESLLRKLPTVYCENCDTHYAPNVPDIAKKHKKKKCKKANS